METAIIASIIAAVITAGGWLVIHFLTKRREKEALQSQAALRHLERQVEELYGPLEGLLTYGNIVYELEQERKSRRPPEQANMDSEVIHYFIENYYIPINQEIIKLVRTKLYLLTDNELPKDFHQFLRHAAMIESLHMLWRKTGAGWVNVPNYDFPNGFREAVSQMSHELRNKHQQLISDVTHGKIAQPKNS